MFRGELASGIIGHVGTARFIVQNRFFQARVGYILLIYPLLVKDRLSIAVKSSFYLKNEKRIAIMFMCVDGKKQMSERV